MPKLNLRPISKVSNLSPQKLLQFTQNQKVPQAISIMTLNTE